MREVIFKSLNFPKSRKREISVEQIVCEDGFLSKTLKKTRYFIQNIRHISTKEDFQKWMNGKRCKPSPNKKWFHILRRYSDKENKAKVFCKARGAFYVIVGRDIYNIVFIHSVKMEINGAKNEKVG
ncbi:MAG: hypothetical protein KAU58_05400 [Candidatus Omnitrophica bacterium]|nr:hypothetical protein [Candidatus Omnitrophota bacterium]